MQKQKWDAANTQHPIKLREGIIQFNCYSLFPSLVLYFVIIVCVFSSLSYYLIFGAEQFVHCFNIVYSLYVCVLISLYRERIMVNIYRL